MVVITGTILAIAGVFTVVGISAAGIIYYLLLKFGQLFRVGGLVPPPEYFFEDEKK